MSGWRNNAGVIFSPWVLCVLSVPFVFGCAKREATTSTNQILRIAQRNEPATLDPQLATLPDEFFVIRALGEGLVTPNPDGGKPLPAMAEHWETSADGLTWTFRLREGAKWSNGDAVTSADFVYSIRRALTPSLAAPKPSLFFALKNAASYYHGSSSDFNQVGLSAPDARTLILTLGQPTPDFLQLVASGPWIPVHAASVTQHGVDWTRPGEYIGNGPFTLKEWSPNQQIKVHRSPLYWDQAAILLDAIHFLAFDNGDAEERAYRTGQLDVTMSVPATKLEIYRKERPDEIHTVPLHETRYLALNTLRPPLDDVRVRRALSLALDRQSLVDKVLKGDQRAAFNFVPPGLGGYQPAALLDENASEARRLLAQAGFPAGRGFPRLELSTWGASTAVLEAIQQRWSRELNTEIVLHQREARSHIAALMSGDYDIGFVTAIPDYASPMDVLRPFATGHPGNYPHWTNPEFDRLLAGGDLTAGAGAEKQLLAELPVIPLYFNAKNYLRNPAVLGWQEDALWTRYYKHVTRNDK